MSRTAAAAATNATRNVKPPTTSASAPPFKPNTLLSFRYEPSPGPMNCTTFTPTKDFATDDSHPFHIRTQRRLQAFDEKKLHWRVQCPVDISNKKFIRSWATKRVQRAFRQSLAENGWGKVGGLLDHEGSSPVAVSGGSVAPRQQPLSGALLMILQKGNGDVALTASDAEVRQSVGWVLKKVMELRVEADGKQRLG